MVFSAEDCGQGSQDRLGLISQPSLIFLLTLSFPNNTQPKAGQLGSYLASTLSFQERSLYTPSLPTVQKAAMSVHTSGVQNEGKACAQL